MRGLEKISWIVLMAVGYLSATFLSGCNSGSSAPPPPAIFVTLSPSTAQKVDQGQSVNLTATLTNDSSNKGVTWSVSGTGCAGAACGTLSNLASAAATYTAPSAVTTNLSVTVTATAVADSTKSATDSMTAFPPPKVTATSLPGGTGGTVYSAALQATGGISPYTWSVTAGAPTQGLSVNTDGSISGTPTASGTSNFTVQVADSGNPPLTATANQSITVIVPPLSISTTSLPNGTVDTAYKQQLQATGGIPPYAWSIASGSLPSWATQNSSTGTISGVPGSTGLADFKVQIADSETPALTSTQALSIAVATAASPNNSELSGHYTFLFNGFDDATGSQVAIAGSFTADGKGKIATGVEDENGPSGPTLNVSFTGTYNIGTDHRGAFTIITASGSKTYALVLSSISSGVAQKARLIEFDDTSGTNGQRGSGVVRLQDITAFLKSGITGLYAFGLIGHDAAGNREAMVGAFSADGTGAISSGIVDQNIAGTLTNPLLAGTYTAPSSTNGRAAMTLTPSGESSLDLSTYVVSATELLVLTTNTVSSDGLLSGTILSQTSASFDNSSLNSSAVYYQLGVNPTAATTQSFAEIGLLSSDGSGGLTATYDKKVGSTLAQGQTFTATYSVLSGGRVTISGWYGDSSSPQRILYLVDKNKAFFLDTDAGVGFGFLEPQSAAPIGGFSNASLSGTFSASTASPSVSLDSNGCGLATLDGSGSFTQIANLSSTSGAFVDQTTTGTYSVAANGRGTVTGLTVTSAGIGGSILGMIVAVTLLLACRKSRLNTSRPGLAMFCFTVLLATTPTSCPTPHPINQLVFYTISPTKAVMIHEGSFDVTPVITVIER
jgi:hypothetical protein